MLAHGFSVNEKDLDKPRKKIGNQWFETQDQIDYWVRFLDSFSDSFYIKNSSLTVWPKNEGKFANRRHRLMPQPSGISRGFFQNQHPREIHPQFLDLNRAESLRLAA